MSVLYLIPWQLRNTWWEFGIKVYLNSRRNCSTVCWSKFKSPLLPKQMFSYKSKIHTFVRALKFTTRLLILLTLSLEQLTGNHVTIPHSPRTDMYEHIQPQESVIHLRRRQRGRGMLFTTSYSKPEVVNLPQHFKVIAMSKSHLSFCLYRI